MTYKHLCRRIGILMLCILTLSILGCTKRDLKETESNESSTSESNIAPAIPSEETTPELIDITIPHPEESTREVSSEAPSSLPVSHDIEVSEPDNSSEDNTGDDLSIEDSTSADSTEENTNEESSEEASTEDPSEETTPEESSEDPSEEPTEETSTEEDPTVSDPLMEPEISSSIRLPSTVTNPVVPLTASTYRAATQYNDTANIYRLAKVIRKAQQGKPVTIGVIGGSITQGTGASLRSRRYASVLETYWRYYFADSSLNFINLGIGATDSYLGLHRISPLLDAAPDLVIIEFCVNDEGNELYQNYFENLVHRILSTSSEPAVLLVMMTQQSGEDASQFEAIVGRKYRLPIISYEDAILPLIESKQFTWEELAPDAVHPSDAGHSLAARLIIRYLQDVIADVDAGRVPESYSVAEFDDTAYFDAEILDSNSIQPERGTTFTKGTPDTEPFTNGWTSTDTEHEITFTVTARNIGVLFQVYRDGTGEFMDVYIDGEYILTLDGQGTKGRSSYHKAIEVYTSDAPKEHTITIKRSPTSEGSRFSLEGLLLS